MIFRHGVLSRRDAFLLLIGASSMHIWSLLFATPPSVLQSDIVINTHVSQPAAAALTTLTTTEVVERTRTQTQTRTETQTQTQVSTKTETVLSMPTPQTLSPHAPLPQTELLAHAPGWTLFRHLYMSNGTLFIVADSEAAKDFPEIRMMTSTGLAAQNTPENIAAREPTGRDMRVVGTREARAMWTSVIKGGKGDGDGKEERVNRVWTVEGNTLLFNDPPQFLRHYYHLVAELFLGVQAFWHGAFSPPLGPLSSSSSSSPSSPLTDPLAAVHYETNHPHAPPIHRAIFAHSNADGWRDGPGFNAYFLRAAFPSLIVEHEEDWRDRILATAPSPSSTSTSSNPNSQGESGRAWHFPLILLVDRSAAFKGDICGARTQRTAAEAYEYMRGRGKLRGVHVGGWWAPLREAVWRFAGVQKRGKKDGTTPREGRDSSAQEPVQQPMHFGSPNPPVLIAGPPTDPALAVGPSSSTQSKLPAPEKVVITYISRQSARNRKLVAGDHEALVEELEGLVRRKNAERRDFLAGVEERIKRGNVGGREGEKEERDGGKREEEEPLEWELAVLEAETLSKDEQVRQAARTTIMLGVHGNGLTHLVFMPPTRAATVIELFFPGGFAHDYQWTTRALGMSHFAVWNDTYHTYPNEPRVDYPEGFQLNEIPVHGPTIAQIIEDRVAGKI